MILPVRSATAASCELQRHGGHAILLALKKAKNKNGIFRRSAKSFFTVFQTFSDFFRSFIKTGAGIKSVKKKLFEIKTLLFGS